MSEKIDFDKTIKKVESLSGTVDMIMRNRLIIAVFLAIDGITFILNPNTTLGEMAKNIIMLVFFAALSIFIANLASKPKDIKTIIISIIIMIISGIAYVYPDLIAAYIQLLLSLFIIYDGLMNLSSALHLGIVPKITQTIIKKYNDIFNRRKIDKKKKAQEEKFKEVDKNINEGLEQQAEKLMSPLKNIVGKTSKSSVLYIILNLASIILGIILLVFPDVSMVVWGIIFLYTGLTNFLIAAKTMNLAKKIKEGKIKEILFSESKKK